jgi:hypothetical protein
MAFDGRKAILQPNQLIGQLVEQTGRMLVCHRRRQLIFQHRGVYPVCPISFVGLFLPGLRLALHRGERTAEFPIETT